MHMDPECDSRLLAGPCPILEDRGRAWVFFSGPACSCGEESNVLVNGIQNVLFNY